MGWYELVCSVEMGSRWRVVGVGGGNCVTANSSYPGLMRA